MENFIVSARKYRPTTFESVVGQEAITQTLLNAIRNNHLAQALLFCGPRGVGKTTCARILAKAINLSDKGEEVTLENTEEDFSFNIFELDAASNNSVEDIRNLIDQVRFSPQIGKFKVYIIDEVHMLSQAAFNAFLKTLEEPPKHAIFILATTEKHKIIPTILSRCQVFDFNRIQIDDIAKHLSKIAEKEGVQAESDALHIIAEKADGALRDALSMFDQIVSYSGNSLTYKATIDNLNILDYDYYFRITDIVLERQIPQALLIFNEILSHGFDGHNFIVGLEQHFRNLMVCIDPLTLDLLEVGANIKDRYKEQAQKCSVPFLLKALSLCNQSDVQYKSSKNQRLLVELSLMQLCSINADGNGLTDQKKNAEPLVAPSQVVGSSHKKKEPNTIQNETQNLSEVVEVQQDATIKQTIETQATEAQKIEQPNETSSAVRAGEEPISQETVTEIADTSEQTQEQEPIPKMVRGGLQGKLSKSSISINEYVEEKKASYNNAETEEERNQEADQFSYEDLIKVWSEITKKAEEARNLTLYSVLSKKPILKDDTTIELILDNKAQEEEINIEKTNIQGEIRQKLNNYNIQITTSINRDETSKKAYTAAEKFKKMADKNPNLNNLKDQLGLEINI